MNKSINKSIKIYNKVLKIIYDNTWEYKKSIQLNELKRITKELFRKDIEFDNIMFKLILLSV